MFLWTMPASSYCWVGFGAGAAAVVNAVVVVVSVAIAAVVDAVVAASLLRLLCWWWLVLVSVLENFTHSDRTPQYIDTYLQVFPKLGKY